MLHDHGGNTSDTMAEDIRDELRGIESRYDVVIPYAAESGSQAWGFPSANSDYDVRFIYVHKPIWYLNLRPQEDFINKQYKDLDMSGWDIQKALRLFRKHNPQLGEWLDSPVVYKDTHNVASTMRQWQKSYFSKRTSLYCYLGMAESENEDILKSGDRVMIKKYLYVLRSILACRHVHYHNTWPPMNMGRLLQTVTPSWQVTESIQKLVERKKRDEHVYTDRVQILDDFIQVSLSDYESIANELEKDEKPIEWDALEKFFRLTLDVIYYPVQVYDGSEIWPHRDMNPQ